MSVVRVTSRVRCTESGQSLVAAACDVVVARCSQATEAEEALER